MATFTTSKAKEPRHVHQEHAPPKYRQVSKELKEEKEEKEVTRFATSVILSHRLLARFRPLLEHLVVSGPGVRGLVSPGQYLATALVPLRSGQRTERQGLFLGEN